VPEIVLGHGLAAMFLVTLLVAIRASACIAKERERQNLGQPPPLPITTRQIGPRKFWGIFMGRGPVCRRPRVVVLA